jgi:hypothetical protein
MEIELTKEGKTRAAKKANRIASPLMGLAIGAIAFGHSLPEFFAVAVLMVIVELVAWRYFLKVEREAAANGQVLRRSLDGE